MRAKEWHAKVRIIPGGREKDAEGWCDNPRGGGKFGRKDDEVRFGNKWTISMEMSRTQKNDLSGAKWGALSVSCIHGSKWNDWARLCGEKRVHTRLCSQHWEVEGKTHEVLPQRFREKSFQEDTVNDTDISEIRQEKDLRGVPGFGTRICNFRICFRLGGLHHVHFTKNNQFAHKKVKRIDSHQSKS